MDDVLNGISDSSPVLSKTSRTGRTLPHAHTRTGSFATKIYRALSVPRREAPSPRPTISSPIAHHQSSIQCSGHTVDTNRRQTGPETPGRPKHPHLSRSLGKLPSLEEGGATCGDIVLDQHGWPISPSPTANGSPVGQHQKRMHAGHSRSLDWWSPGERDRKLNSGPGQIYDMIENSCDWPTSPSSFAPSLDISITPPSSALRAPRGRHHSLSAAHKLTINTSPSRQNSAESALSVPSLLSALTSPTNESSPIATASASTATSLRSTASAQFRIKRKPVPLVDEFGNIMPARQVSAPWPSAAGKTPTRVARHKSLDPRNVPDHKSQTEFQVELDRLFDELFDECRAGAAIPTGCLSPAPPTLAHSTPAHGTHSRSRSEHPQSLSSSVLRVRSLRQSRILRDSDANNAATTTTETDKRTQPKGNPFFAPGRPFGASRSSGRPRTTPGDGMTTTGRVRNAVMEIERKNPTPTSSRAATPIKTLGTILDRAPLIDSTELSLESKRMMEVARRRRSIR
ncbi:uncharacterized protein CcaverHIS019_0302150 [Cutaneotrichosporon cavernicola]|uniref:Uncharacterized protein n=1 Tax=Cutaneotrichosporon cavernicola TaxID=279322 RepID=A0AA48I980_9TREE|nr:uncharacterized protein CcaverHIS019_0302150 [Cutaneotrichosporon cavernicola]BEI90145.1 hypothetical protein CcaverHIS019_0302150 [Cutaneotrichosporon cavernicola]BEI97923.1 hypothetical protein CcaverHIS631_0302220 [Cutaneotrichosporon cavernicola]